MGICANCKHKAIPGYCYPCCRCDAHIEYVAVEKAVDIRTNADRIRAMSDEELAGWMIRYQLAVVEETLRHLGTDEHLTALHEAIGKDLNCSDLAKWLKQPAEETPCGA